MAQYIDKSAVVAEIKRRIDSNNEKAAYYSSGSEHDYLYRIEENVYKDLISFLDTLKVKEVDLEQEIDDYIGTKEVWEIQEAPLISIENAAKHFFELGLKAQKGD